jgi:hypothetical protein
MANRHYQIRFVKTIENDGKLITFPRLGRPYEHHDQWTLKSYHLLDEVVELAIKCNPDLPPHVKGMVIVGFQAGGARISAGRTVSPYVGGNPRKRGTTDWLLFIDRKGKLVRIIEGSHKIRQQP